MRRLLTGSITLAALVTAWFLGVTPAFAYPPTPPSESTARTQLNALTVKAEGSSTGYSRDKFPHWHTVSGTCDTRDEVLKRDGTGVTVDSDCEPTAGTACTTASTSTTTRTWISTTLYRHLSRDRCAFVLVGP